VRALIASIFVCMFVASPAVGQSSGAVTPAEAPPSEASIREVLEVTQARKLVEGMSGQLDDYFAAAMKQALDGKVASAGQQEVIDHTRPKFKALMSDWLKWESMERMYLEVYAKSFSQSEVDSMIKFYGSPAGHALVVKLPLVNQNLMSAVQQRMQSLIPKIQQIAKDAANEATARQAPAGQ
jgi:uncharacterized protein